jgi:hypothetical protein
VSETTAEKYRRHFETAILPPGWQPVTWHVDGVRIPCYYLSGSDPNRIIGYCTGLKASPFTHVGDINAIARDGSSLVIISLPPPDEGDENFMKFYREIIRAFYFDRSSPLYTRGNPDLPVDALTHSTSALAFLQVRMEHGMPERLRNAFCMNAIIDTANSSEETSSLLCAGYNAHAEMHRDEFIGESVWDRAYLRLKGAGHDANGSSYAYEPPKHGEVRVLKREGHAFMKT